MRSSTLRICCYRTRPLEAPRARERARERERERERKKEKEKERERAGEGVGEREREGNIQSKRKRKRKVRRGERNRSQGREGHCCSTVSRASNPVIFTPLRSRSASISIRNRARADKPHHVSILPDGQSRRAKRLPHHPSLLAQSSPSYYYSQELLDCQPVQKPWPTRLTTTITTTTTTTIKITISLPPSLQTRPLSALLLPTKPRNVWPSNANLLPSSKALGTIFPPYRQKPHHVLRSNNKIYDPPHSAMAIPRPPLALVTPPGAPPPSLNQYIRIEAITAHQRDQ